MRERPHLREIRLHPFKALDPVRVSSAVVAKSGGLLHDRRWALFDAEGRWINGKGTPRVHPLRARFDLEQLKVIFTTPRDGASPLSVEFSLRTDLDLVARWLSSWFGQPVEIRENPESGFPDDTLSPGPTVVSSESLEQVCSWFSGITLEAARRRFRANLEIAGVPPFWEDRLFGPPGETVRFRIGDVLVEGNNPCARCTVPPRDPETGEPIPDFPKRFAELRRRSLPPWAPAERFDHFYRLAVNTRISPSEAGKALRVGDPVSLL